jgi:tetratricopeptide (TPR) repeat protein/predicted transcriptional regulator
MTITKPDLLLYLIHQNDIDSKRNNKVSIEQVSRSLNVQPPTIKVYLSNLDHQDLINRKKKRYVEFFLDTIQITNKGKNLVEDTIVDELEKIHFTPERHFIDSCIPYSELSKMISNPLDRVFLLTMYKKKYKFDLYSFVSNIKSVKDDSKVEKIINDDGKSKKNENFLSAFYNVSLYGKDVHERLKNPGYLDDFNTDTLIIQAESYLKKGDFDKSEKLYSSLLTIDRKLTQNQWFLVNIGLINVLRKKEQHEEALEMMDRLERDTKDKRFRCYIKQMRALELGLRGKHDESISQFNSAINSSYKIGSHLLTDICLANRGVIHFIRKDHDKAEKDWRAAIEFARKAKSRYSEGKNLGNLADIEILKGNHDTAWKYLDESETIFFDLEDHEGISMIAFNKGLYYLSMKKLDQAIQEFERFRTIAQPLPGPHMLNLLKNAFINRAKENGFDDIETYL